MGFTLECLFWSQWNWAGIHQVTFLFLTALARLYEPCILFLFCSLHCYCAKETQTGGREPDCSVCWQRHREIEVRKGKCFSLCSQCLVILISFSVSISQRMVYFQAEDATWINIFFFFCLGTVSQTVFIYSLTVLQATFNQPIKCVVVCCISSSLMHVFHFFHVPPS